MNNWRGPALMTGQALCFAVETATIHSIHSLTLPQLALLRTAGGTALILCFIPLFGWRLLRTSEIKLQLCRGASAASYLAVMMYALVHMPLTDATAISQTQGVYMVVLGYLLLHETASLRQWFAVALGLLGAVWLINPAFSAAIIATYLVVLALTSLNALTAVLSRLVQGRDHADVVDKKRRLFLNGLTVTLYTNLFGLVCYSPALPGPWPEFDVRWLAVLLVGPIGMLLGNFAVQYSSMAVVAPFTYVRLVAIGFIAPLLFGEPLTVRLIIGSLLIVVACLLASSPPRRTR
jgi:drug/metabolite transporter (DMT)-like permease